MRIAAVSLALRGLLCALATLIISANPADSADLSAAAGFFQSAGAATVEQPQGSPPAAVIRGPDGKLLGYAFSTYEVSGSVGYAGRPLDIVAAITPEGIVAGAQIVAHEEPILVIGIPRDALAAYVRNFAGFDTRAGAALKPADGMARGPHAVAGATITSTVIRDAILRSARAVLRSRGPATDSAARLDRETLRRSSWHALVAEGAVQRKLVTRGEAARMLGTQDPEPDKPFIELWLALAIPPPIGESLLGQRAYESELARIGPDDDLILIGASGLYSFKGTDWRQSGAFNRIEFIQGGKTFRLKAADHTQIEALRAAGAPELREIAVFRVAKTSGFDSTKPFRLDLDLGTPSPGSGPAVVTLEYRIPERYLIAPPAPPAAAPPGKAQAVPESNGTLWQDIWWARRFEIGVLGIMLAVLAGILVFQDSVTAHGKFYYRLRTGYLLLTLIFLGFIANAQLSVVNVLTFIHALLSGFRWELFLLDPLVFLLWSFVAVSMLFWGRGVFCGWLCPFGTLQELTNELAQRLGIKQIEIPFGLHERLWMIKYVAFVGILAVSFRSILGAFQLAEIEPFKTAITMKFLREWPFVIYAGVLLFAGVFVERFYCRYLCPLGAALAIPARMRMFEWLKRYRECGSECHVCARRCTVQAIHPLGQINPNECIYCLKCQANYFDHDICLHLKKRAQRRQPLTLTPGKPAGETGERP
ncbi:NosR/NirI family protein [Bradyrhizobium sp.]|uniref:NosR/NirI family protein n=1 Tax=Bradyrhizobium sp. TaxID=376 RepID=UPI001D6C4374|nr:NosR/NirI family protein [Bradyrhizobium sp.]MBI5321933.1 regulatory protein NosR [Bradyrhizobium sp.]